MPLYNLPLEASGRPSSRAHLYARTSKKRRRASSPDAESADDVNPSGSSSVHEDPSSPAKSINPLSLTPDEILQYKLAGLDLDQELPSKTVPGFPHRALPASFHAREKASHAENGISDSDVDGPRAQRGAPFLRMQHLSVLNTILHRCLLEGDIPRASRAWSMLLRAQVNGKGVDIRGSCYWGIGAELLIRSGENLSKRSTGVKDENSENGSEEADVEEEATRREANGVERRWGTQEGLEKAKDYYERLILQHPYRRQFHNFINSLDFYPAMLSCEVYGIQFSQKEDLLELERKERSSSPAVDEMESYDEDENLADQVYDLDAQYGTPRRKEARTSEQRRELFWKKREDVRMVALSASEKVAARMDDLMLLPPYNDNIILQRLRGMLALYIGDLSVPGLSDEDDQDNHGDDRDSSSGDERANWVSDKVRTEKRLLERRRKAEHERGLIRREEEREKANIVFEMLRKSSEKAGIKVESAHEE